MAHAHARTPFHHEPRVSPPFPLPNPERGGKTPGPPGDRDGSAREKRRQRCGSTRRKPRGELNARVRPSQNSSSSRLLEKRKQQLKNNKADSGWLNLQTEHRPRRCQVCRHHKLQCDVVSYLRTRPSGCIPDHSYRSTKSPQPRTGTIPNPKERRKGCLVSSRGYTASPSGRPSADHPEDSPGEGPR